MTYAYTILAISTIIAALAAGYVLVSLGRPERETVHEPGVTYTVLRTEMRSGGNIYSVDVVRPTMASRWLLALCAVLFCFAVFYLLSKTLNVVHKGVDIPVEQLAKNLADFIENKRPTVIGKTWASDDSIQDTALFLMPTEIDWQIEIFGRLPDIRDSFIAPAGLFSRCEVINTEDSEFQHFRVVTTDPTSACDWIFRHYLHYPDGTKIELSVRDGEPFARRLERATTAPI